GDLTDAKWLRYDKRSKDFLFCAFSKDGKGRHLYRLSSTNIICLTEDSSYNGQFLHDLEGYAYVVNTNDGFHLAVRPSAPSLQTNLFQLGAVINYTVAPTRDVIYATAVEGGEPTGIW